MELNFEGLGMQKWNKSIDRSQRADEKNGLICLVIIFTTKVMVISISEIALFFVCSADDNKKLLTVWTKYLRAPERSYSILLENGMGKKWHLANGSSEPNNL